MGLMQTFASWPAILILLSGCVAPRDNQVRQKLNVYQIGVTRFEDFQKDAGLVLIERDSPATAPRHSYLNPNPTPSQSMQPPKLVSYATPKGSAWKIVEQKHETHFSFPKSAKNYDKWSFVVGDKRGPICILIFEAGTLSDKKPAE
jgi:hypothetical protein